MKDKIAPFEQALLKIGSTHVGLEHLPRGDKRSEKVGLMYRVYGELLGIQVDEGNEKATPDLVLRHLQELLGVEQLSRLRAVAIARATDDLEK